MVATKFRTQFDDNYKSSVFDTDVGEDEGLVQQNMAAECDINNIMAKYQKTGELTHLAAIAGQYGDFSDVTDYKTGLERIYAADDLFMELPSSIRDRFDNDPAQFVEFATNKENLEELREMGLAPRPPEPKPTQTAKGPEGETPPGKTGDQ